MKLKSVLLFLAVFILAAVFRLYGVNWDQNQHLHPDERFLTMVTGALDWPENLYAYLDTGKSPLNPNNRGFGFFVYGTAPLFLTRYIAESVKSSDYNGITIIGRRLSALVDLATVVLVFLIAGYIRLFPNKSKRSAINPLPYLAMFMYAVLVSPVQLSHFYAVDTWLVFFLMLAFYLFIHAMRLKETPRKIFLSLSLLTGVALGLAAASKISAVLFLPVMAIGLLIEFIRRRFPRSIVMFGLVLITAALFTFRFAQPYAFSRPSLLSFSINENFLESLKTLKSFDGPDTAFPPALQWIPTAPYAYPFLHLTLWGTGLPFMLLFIISVVILIIKKRVFSDFTLLLALIWIITLFGYQAGQFAKTLRYLYPLLPASALVTAAGTALILKNIKSSFQKSILMVALLSILLIYPVSFLRVYSRPHSRIIASEWIYENIPAGKKLAVEHWDDGLPLTLDNSRLNVLYKFITLPLYNPDSSAKWQEIIPLLNQADYIVITSNRLWRSLSALPARFPQTARYYRSLFDGSLGFMPLAAFSSYPCLIPEFSSSASSESPITDLTPQSFSFTRTPYCLLALNDDGAEESFTVYDHPKVVIFKKTPLYSENLFLEKVASP